MCQTKQTSMHFFLQTSQLIKLELFACKENALHVYMHRIISRDCTKNTNYSYAAASDRNDVSAEFAHNVKTYALPINSIQRNL